MVPFIKSSPGRVEHCSGVKRVQINHTLSHCTFPHGVKPSLAADHIAG